MVLATGAASDSFKCSYVRRTVRMDPGNSRHMEEPSQRASSLKLDIFQNLDIISNLCHACNPGTCCDNTGRELHLVLPFEKCC